METLATGGVVDEFEVDSSSEEYQLLMAYCAKRKRQRSGFQAPAPELQGGGPKVLQGCLSDPQGLVNQGHFDGQVYRMASDVPDKKRKMNTRMVKGGAVMAQHQSGTVSLGGAVRKGRNLTGVADRLAQIADSVLLTSDDTEADGLDDQEDIIQKLVELVKNSGDQLNEEIKRNKALQKHLQSSFNYALFEQVTSTFQEEVVVGEPAGQVGSEERVQKKQIALAFEVTHRLSAVDLVPMSRAMGYGAHYVRLHHSSWVQQHGGWGKAFAYEDID